MISLAQALRTLSLGFSLLSPVHTYLEGWESETSDEEVSEPLIIFISELL